MIKNYVAAMLYKKCLEDLKNTMDTTFDAYPAAIFDIDDEETVNDIQNLITRARASIRRAEELMDERIKDYYRIISENKESE